MLAPRDQFKVAVLDHCARAGMSADEMLECVRGAREKLAGVGNFFGSLGTGLLGLGRTGLAIGAGTAAAAPLVVGYQSGKYLSQLGDTDTVGVDEIQKQELLEEYRRQIERARHNYQTMLRRRSAQPAFNRPV